MHSKMSKLVKLSIVVVLLASYIAIYQPHVFTVKYMHDAAAKYPILVSFFKWFHGAKGSNSGSGNVDLKDGSPKVVDPNRVFTKEELAKYKGEDGADIYIALMGRVFDVTRGRDFYGPGGGYSFFSGKITKFAVTDSCYNIIR